MGWRFHNESTRRVVIGPGVFHYREGLVIRLSTNIGFLRGKREVK